MKKLGQYLLEDNRRAVMVAFIAIFLPLVGLPGGFIAAIILALITLIRGWRSGLSILMWIALPSMSLLVLGRIGYFDLVLLNCVAVWMAALVLRRTRSWHLLIELSAVLALAFVCALHVYFVDVQHIWQLVFQSYLKQYASMVSWDVPQESMTQSFRMILPLVTGLLAVQNMLGVWLPTYLSEKWQAVFVGGTSVRNQSRWRLAVISLVTLLIMVAAFISKAALLDGMPIVILLLLSWLIELGQTCWQRHSNFRRTNFTS